VVPGNFISAQKDSASGEGSLLALDSAWLEARPQKEANSVHCYTGSILDPLGFFVRGWGGFEGFFWVVVFWGGGGVGGVWVFFVGGRGGVFFGARWWWVGGLCWGWVGGGVWVWGFFFF